MLNFTDGKLDLNNIDESELTNETETINNLIENILKTKITNTVTTHCFKQNKYNYSFNKIYPESIENYLNKVEDPAINTKDDNDIDTNVMNKKVILNKVFYFIGSLLSGMLILNTFILLTNEFSSYSLYALRISHIIFLIIIANIVYSYDNLTVLRDKYNIYKRENNSNLENVKALYQKCKFQLLFYVIIYGLSLIMKRFTWEISISQSNINSANKYIITVFSIIQMILAIIGFSLDSKEYIQQYYN